MKKRAGRLPDFIIIGAAKAGTTSLDFYLSLHPEIQMARPKEPRFFIDADEPLGRWRRGTDWYKNLYRSEKRICGEASPAYSHWPALPEVPERMARLIPQVKLIYLVREPMSRIKSHYLMHCRQYGTRRPLAEFLREDQKSHCVLASNYGSQLRRYLDWFPLDQILVMESKQLDQNRSAALQEVFRFLGVAPGFSTHLFFHRRNVSRQQPIPNELGRRLRDSKIMLMARKVLPSPLYYHLRNAIVFPFRQPPPTMDLPEDLSLAFQAHWTYEMNLLRSLCGKPLPSLEYV